MLDICDARADANLETVMHTLDSIGATEQPRVLVQNKIDAMEHNADLLIFEKQHPQALAISARTGLQVDQVVEKVRDAMRGGWHELRLDVPVSDGKAAHFLESRATVLDRRYEGDRVLFTVRIGRRQLDQFRASGAKFDILEAEQA